MADVEPQRIVEQWSALTPGDLGLKAGFYPAVEGGPVTFRPIVGWVSVTRHDRAAMTTTNLLIAVVVADVAVLMPATMLEGYLGTFPKQMTPAEAWRFSKQWRKANAGPNAQALVPTQAPGKA